MFCVVLIFLFLVLAFRVLWPWMARVKITHLYVYPIKSCRGIQCDAIKMTRDGGLKHDREWAILDARTNKILTCREKPSLVRISPSFSPTLRLTFPDGSTASTIDNEEMVFTTQLWTSECAGIDQGDDASFALSRYLEAPRGTIRLIRMKRCARLLSDCRKYGALVGKDERARFSDWSTLTLISNQTVDAIRKHSGLHDLNATWFRPNVVVDVSSAYVEESWQRFQIRGLFFSSDDTMEFQVLKKCARCVESCVDPRTGRFTKGFEPLKTLRSIRGGFYDFVPRSSPFHKREAFAAINLRQTSDQVNVKPFRIKVGNTIRCCYPEVTPPSLKRSIFDTNLRNAETAPGG